jgi:hypothetical protein
MNIDINNTSIYTNTNSNHLSTEDNLSSLLLLNNNSLEGVSCEETQTSPLQEDMSTKAALLLLTNNNNLETEALMQSNQPVHSQEQQFAITFQQLLQQSLQIQKTLREENAKLEMKITQQQEVIDSLIQKTREIKAENENLRAVLNFAISTPAIKQSTTNTTSRITDFSSLSNAATSSPITSNYWLLSSQTTPNKSNTGEHLSNSMFPSASCTTTTDVTMEPVTQGVEIKEFTTRYISPNIHNEQGPTNGKSVPWFEKRVYVGNGDCPNEKESFSHSSYEFVQHNTQEIQAWINAYHSSKSKKKRKYTRRISQHK